MKFTISQFINYFPFAEITTRLIIIMMYLLQPSSKLDELFIHEVNKYKKRSEKVENISVDNFNEKYEKTLAELKNEEQKFNK